MSTNTLERTILDQHARVQAAGTKGHEVLGEAKAEILSIASPEQTQEILDKVANVTRILTDPSIAHLQGVNAPGSLPRNLAKVGGSLYQLSDSGFIVPDQGYVGLITLDDRGRALDAFGFSVARGQRLVETESDPIQQACGPDFFYPAMMWAKALYSEAYNNRPDSQKALSIQVWLAELAGEGLFQGSKPGYHGLLGATGFMPSEEMIGILKRDEVTKEHIESEAVEEFRASGMMDQAALMHLTSDSGVSWEEVGFQARVILGAGGSLN